MVCPRARRDVNKSTHFTVRYIYLYLDGKIFVTSTKEVLFLSVSVSLFVGRFVQQD